MRQETENARDGDNMLSLVLGRNYARTMAHLTLVGKMRDAFMIFTYDPDTHVAVSTSVAIKPAIQHMTHSRKL